MRDVFKKTLLTLLLMACPVSANISANLPRSDGITRDECYIQELNNYHNHDGSLVHSIVLYLDECGCSAVSSYHLRVIDWRYLDDKRTQIPRKNSQGSYIAFFEDPKFPGVLLEVTSKRYDESHTFYDKERRDRDLHSICDRRELKNPKHELSKNK